MLKKSVVTLSNRSPRLQSIRSRNSWTEQSARQKFFDDLGTKLGVKSLDDWYSILSKKVLQEHGGSSLLALYSGSPTEALTSCYPNYNWIPWKFNSTPQGFWKSLQNQRQFFDWLAKELGVKHLDDWYSVLNGDIFKQYGVTRIISLYKGSPSDALMSCYPEHTWFPWKFGTVKHNYWKSLDNRKQFFEWLGKKEGVTKLDDWYSVITAKLLLDNGGGALLYAYNGSPMEALKSCYLNHHWVPWKFKMTPLGYWSSRENISQFMSELSEKLSIQTLDDWYRVDQSLLVQFGASSLLKKYGGLMEILKQQYPNHSWKANQFVSSRKTQRWLTVTLKEMFPREEVLEDYIHPKAFSPTTQRPLQLDAFIPSRSLAFEYQGKQHYQDIGVFQPSKMYQKRDEEKRAICKSNNISLIEVPYWWNRTPQALQKLIHVLNPGPS